MQKSGKKRRAANLITLYRVIIDLLRSYYWRKIMIRRSICGVWDASLQSCCGLMRSILILIRSLGGAYFFQVTLATLCRRGTVRIKLTKMSLIWVRRTNWRLYVVRLVHPPLWTALSSQKESNKTILNTCVNTGTRIS